MWCLILGCMFLVHASEPVWYRIRLESSEEHPYRGNTVWSAWTDGKGVFEVTMRFGGEHDAETGLNDAETRLNDAETGLNDAETGLNEAETGLNEAETGFNEAETGLNDVWSTDGMTIDAAAGILCALIAIYI